MEHARLELCYCHSMTSCVNSISKLFLKNSTFANEILLSSLSASVYVYSILVCAE